MISEKIFTNSFVDDIDGLEEETETEVPEIEEADQEDDGDAEE